MREKSIIFFLSPIFSYFCFCFRFLVEKEEEKRQNIETVNIAGFFIIIVYNINN